MSKSSLSRSDNVYKEVQDPDQRVIANEEEEQRRGVESESRESQIEGHINNQQDNRTESQRDKQLESQQEHAEGQHDKQAESQQHDQIETQQDNQAAILHDNDILNTNQDQPLNSVTTVPHFTPKPASDDIHSISVIADSPQYNPLGPSSPSMGELTLETYDAPLPNMLIDENYIQQSYFEDPETASILLPDEISLRSDLQAKPTTAISLAGSLADLNELASLTSSKSAVPTMTTDPNSDVATLLSEVLNEDKIDGQSHYHKHLKRHSNKHLDIESSSRVSKGSGSASSHVSKVSNVSTESSKASHMISPDPEWNISQQSSSSSSSCGSDDEPINFLSHSKHYFVLSTAGKPIYSMHGSDEIISGYMGIIQAILSYFDSDPSQELRSFRAGNALFVVSVQEPLIFVAIDKLGQSEFQLRSQLDVLYAQIQSTLTRNQIHKVFKGRTNFDLRQLLGGTEVFLDALAKEMTIGSPAILLGALECLRLRKSVRDNINTILLQCKTTSLLYGLIVADSRLVNVIRPRRHSLHPPDLLLIFSMLFNTASFKQGTENWVPICLPKFNASGFLYAYISFFADKTALVLISPDKGSFFEHQQAKTTILESLQEQDLLQPIAESVAKGRFKSLDIPAPLIRHFLFKSKGNVQFVMPSFEPHYYEESSRHKLMMLYHQLHAAVHAKQGHLRVYHITRQNVSALAWVTPTFEMYCVTGSTTREAMLQSVWAAISWIKKNERRLFVVGGAVF